MPLMPHYFWPVWHFVVPPMDHRLGMRRAGLLHEPALLVMTESRSHGRQTQAVRPDAASALQPPSGRNRILLQEQDPLANLRG